MSSLLVRRLEAATSPWSAASAALKRGVGALFFESQAEGPKGERWEGSRYSILLTEPSEWLIERRGKFFSGPKEESVKDPLEWLHRQHQQIQYQGELPFVGGLAGYLSFEFGWALDDLTANKREAKTPELFVGRYDSAAVYDHLLGNWFLLGREREELQRWEEVIEGAGRKEGSAANRAMARRSSEKDREVSRELYERGVRRAVEDIYAGEFFEVNYTERFQGRWSRSREELYGGLRRLAPGDFGGFVSLKEVFIASISPEQFLSVDVAGKVQTRPIKGTRPRGASDEEDRRNGRELLESSKDRAENVMIVDLMRNDLTRFCVPGTVKVTELCGLHSFASVHHLISTVEGELSEDVSALEAFLAAFPAGSITGAPKLRSMEWIAENEGSPRGPYTGSMFYWSDHGMLNSNVLIRTAVLNGEEVSYGAGGAVVADSDPEGEYREARWKARPFFEVLEGVDEF